uniref:High mobility group box 2a n=1 Tax=Oryzias latipes TaxID=8090 RepID=A0A3P9IM38_ORYLA
MTKDPNKPRGKTSAYAYFVATCREEHKKKHPGTSVNFSEFSKKCSERWKVGPAFFFLLFAGFDQILRFGAAILWSHCCVTCYFFYLDNVLQGEGAKKVKKKKDPNAPKRPPSAFFVFCSDHRPKIKEDNPGISIGDIAKKLGELWATQSAKDKAPYEAKAAKLKEKYEKDVAAYRAKGGSGKSDAGKKSGPGRPAAKKAVPVHDDDDDDDEEDEDDEEDDDEDDDE